MKRVLLILVSLLSLPSVVLSTNKVYTTDYDVRLSSLLGEDRNEIDSIKLRGHIEKEDLELLRNLSMVGSLRHLDISETSIKGDSLPSHCFDGHEFLPGYLPYNTMLKSIVLPYNLTSINSCAFANSEIRKIVIQRDIKSISSDAFLSCPNLEEVIIKESFPPSSNGQCPFSGVGNNLKVFIPRHSLSNYNTDAQWRDADIDIIEDERALVVRSVDLSSARLSSFLSGVQYMTDSLRLSGEITDSDFIVIRDELTNGMLTGIDFSECVMPDDAFPEMSLYINESNYVHRLMHIRFPNGLKRIETCAIGAPMLREIELPSTLSHIGEDNFAGNAYASTIVIPEGVDSIEKDAFLWCNGAETIYLPSTIRYLGGRSFRSLVKLRSIYCNRLTPPETPYSSGDDEFGPFGRQSEYDEWILYVPVGAKQNYMLDDYFKYFGSIIETSELTGGPTAIDGVESGVTERGNGYADGVYTLDGKRIADTITDGMAKGLYVVKRGTSISKVAVR